MHERVFLVRLLSFACIKHKDQSDFMEFSSLIDISSLSSDDDDATECVMAKANSKFIVTFSIFRLDLQAQQHTHIPTHTHTNCNEKQ